MNYWSSLSERDRRALSLAAAAAAVFLLVRLVVFPVWDALSASEGAIPVREKMFRKYRSLAEATPARENDFHALQARLAAAEGGLLSSHTAPLAAAEVQQQVRDLAGSLDIQIRSMDFLPQKKLGSPQETLYASVPISAQFTARVDQLAALLGALDRGPKMLAVDQLRISAANEPGKKHVNVYLVVAGVAGAEVLPPTGQ